jgi:hypothetical protein
MDPLVAKMAPVIAKTLVITRTKARDILSEPDTHQLGTDTAYLRAQAR